MSALHYYNIKYSEVFIFENFMIKQIKEGTTVGLDHLDTLNDIIKKHFNGKEFVYVSNRIHSYSVDPLVYKEVEKIPNLKAIAIITPEIGSMRKIAEYEKKFYHKPFGIFSNIIDTIIWIQNIMNNKTN